MTPARVVGPGIDLVSSPRTIYESFSKTMRDQLSGGSFSTMTMRRWAVDVGLGAVVAVVVQLEIWAPQALITPTHMTGPRAAVSAAYLLATLALVLRTRLPLTAVVLMFLPLSAEWIAFGSPESFGTFVLVMLAAYSVAVQAKLDRAAVGFGVLLAASAIWTLSDPKRSSFNQHVGGLVWLLPAVLLWVTGVWIRKHRIADEQRAAAVARVEREERARAAVEEERARIARELHDAVGHSVSVMTVQASAVRRRLTAEQLQELDALTAVEQTRREALAPQPGLDRLDRLVEHVRAAGLPVEVRIEAVCRRKESPMSSSMVNFIEIIVRRSGAMSLKPC
jgi:signal transduction histidine kinase